MRIALLAVAMAAAIAPAGAQEKAPEPPKQPQVRKVVQLKYADPEAMRALLEVFGCCARTNQTFKTLSLNYPADIMPALEDAIRRFDVPAAAPKNVELTAYFVIASDTEGAAGSPLPPDLEPVLKQLRSIFAYKSFAVLDSPLLRMGSGQGGQADGVRAMPTGPPGTTATRLRVRRWTLATGDKGDVVTLDNLSVEVRMPLSQGGANIRIETGGVALERIDLPVGQKVVVGKSNIEGPGKALIVVLSAKVL